MQPSRGFTLIELMIVIAIVGILASIAAPSYRDYVQKAVVSQGFSMAQSVKTSVAETYNLEGSFPAARTTFYANSAADADVSEVFWHPGNSTTGGGIIEVNFGPGAGNSLQNKRLWLKPDTTNSSMIKWSCHTHYISSLAIPESALPGDCTAWTS